MSTENPVTKNLRDAVVTVKDGASPPNMLELVLEEGDLTYTRPGPSARQIMDRGSLSHLREGNQEPVSGSMTLKFNQLIAQTAASYPTLYDALKNQGNASSWVSTDPHNALYLLAMDMIIQDPEGGNQHERKSFTEMHFENIEFSEGDEYDTLSFDFIAYETEPTVFKTDCTTSCQASCQTTCQTGCETSTEA